MDSRDGFSDYRDFPFSSFSNLADDTEALNAVFDSVMNSDGLLVLFSLQFLVIDYLVSNVGHQGLWKRWSIFHGGIQQNHRFIDR